MKLLSQNKLKNFIKSVIEEWNFNLDPNKEYDLNQRKEFEYELDGKQPEFNRENYKTYLENIKSFYQKKLSETNNLDEKTKIQTKISELEKLTPKQIYEDYINEEKAFYQKINDHNKATAKFKTQKKVEKLKNLTLEKIAKINDYVTQINKIAEKYGLDEKIEFGQAKFLERQKNLVGKIQISKESTEEMITITPN